MKVVAIKTHKISAKDRDLLQILDKYLPKIEEKSVVAVTSKIVAICEGRTVPIEKKGEEQKDALIEQEAQYYLPRNTNKYNVSLTITRNTLVATAGIDESNADGNYILWPRDPQAVANDLRGYLKRRFLLKEIGVIITDSRTVPLRWGVTAQAIAYSGFEPLKNYAGTSDLFGRKFVFEKLHIADSLAASAGLVMGEGAEQTPLAVIEDIPNIEFQDHNPIEEEIKSLQITMDEDLYAPLLQSVQWKKGKKV